MCAGDKCVDIWVALPLPRRSERNADSKSFATKISITKKDQLPEGLDGGTVGARLTAVGGSPELASSCKSLELTLSKINCITTIWK